MGTSRYEVFLKFWPILTGPGCQSNEQKFRFKICLETRWCTASIEPLIDLLVCLEPKLWPKKKHFAPKSENRRKCIESSTGVNLIWDNSLLEHASELFEASKDSWSLVVCTAIKPFWDLDSGFSAGGVGKRVGFAFFLLLFYDVITRTMGRNCSSKFGCILSWNMNL